MGNKMVIADKNVELKIRAVGLKPTRQRVGLARLLFSGCARHVTADELFAEASESGVPVSLATVYNTLRQFVDVGLLREVLADPELRILILTFLTITTSFTLMKIDWKICLQDPYRSMTCRMHLQVLKSRE